MGELVDEDVVMHQVDSAMALFYSKVARVLWGNMQSLDCEYSSLLFIVLGLHIYGMYVSWRLSVIFEFTLVLGPLFYCCCYYGPGIGVDLFATFYDISIYNYLMSMNKVMFIMMK